VVRLSGRLLAYAAGRWPAEQRADRLREWTAELYMLAHDGGHSRWSRGRRALAYSVSLLSSRPDRAGDGLPGLRRGGPVVVTAFAVLLLITVNAQALLNRYLNDDWAQPLHNPGPGLSLALAVVALLPVALAAAAGWVVARSTRADRRIQALRLGGYLIAVVAVMVGIAFSLEVLADVVGDVAVLNASTMGYHYGRQPIGMIVSWVAWLGAFWVAARICTSRRAARTPAYLRGVLGLLGAVLATGLAVTVGTFAQFESWSAPRDEMALWFGQWLVPINTFDVDLGGIDWFGSVRGAPHLLTSWPHVLFACAAFGMAYLLTARPAPATVPAPA
jgi:hypothetical protein